MRISSVIGLYFSPTGTTRTLVTAAAEQAAQTLGVPCRLISLNTPAERETEFHFSADTLVIVGAPTYAGRLPNKISPDLRRILHSSGSPAVALVTYGNRAYENALAELFRVLTDGGMKPAAGAVCVCQHSIARALAVGRPNEEDCAEVRRFAAEVAERIQADEIVLSPAVPGDADSSYYVPTGTSGKPAKFLKSAPSRPDPKNATAAAAARHYARWGSTAAKDPSIVSGICIKCQACILGCRGAQKFFDDEQFLSHARMLEQKFAGIHKENEFYLVKKERNHAEAGFALSLFSALDAIQYVFAVCSVLFGPNS